MTGTGEGAWYAMSNMDSLTAMTTRNCLAVSSGAPESDPRICKSEANVPLLFCSEKL